MADIRDEAKAASTETFVTALVFNAAVFGIELAAFTLLRPYFQAIYEPRTYVPPKQKRIPSITSTLWAWPIALIKADYRDIKVKNGLDAYFFVRFLRMMVKILFPIWIISWGVLLPVTSVNTGRGNNSGLARFTFGNVGLDDQERYAAHIILVYFFTGWIFYVIRAEMRHFVVTRQAYLISPAHSSSLQATSILITGIPPRYLSEAGIRAIFKHLPGKVSKIWINRDLKDLPDAYDRREAACNTLESAETKLIKLAHALREKANKKGDKQQVGEVDAEGDHTLAAKLVPEKDRPQHRLGWFPFTGEKVDTIQWAREEINICNKILEEGREAIAKDRLRSQNEDYDPNAVAGSDRNALQEARHIAGHAAKLGGAVAGTAKSAISKLPVVGAHGEERAYPPFNSAFVQFDNQIAAHMAAQVLTHHAPYQMCEKYIEVAPQDIIWRNLNMTTFERKIRTAISYALTAGLIITWAFPVAFVGAVSNINKLCVDYSWLAWICDLPPAVKGIITGIFPPVALAILMMLLPIILRLFASFEGIPSKTGVEMSLMTRYFIFQVIHSFLIVTLSSGIIAALGDLSQNPGQIPSLLAQNLPLASTFFLTYIILTGLSGTAGGFLQIVPLIIYYVKLVLLGSTPRAVYNIKYTLRSVAWGTLFPSITLLTTIALGYQIISPIINGLACFAFMLYFLLYKYLFLYVYGFGTGQGGGATDTGGLFFPKAIKHIFVGLYVQQICQTALFFLARDKNNNVSAIPHGALMIVLIVFTAGFQFIMSQSFGPLITALPLSLADKTYHATQDSDSVNSEDRGDIETVDREDKHKHKGKPHSETSLEDEKYGFLHPAASRPQRTVWLPRDSLGLGEAEETECIAAGVDASTQYAVLNEKGKVDVSGAPPDVLVGQRVLEADDA